MAEAPEGEPLPSSSEDPMVLDVKDDEEPSPKKRKTDSAQSEKLEHRLGGILCCAVCLDLPQAAVYQCSNGHLMCAPCFTHLLADARLRDEAATCPNCRVEISKTSASRNLAVEKTVSELPSECKHCTKVFPRHSLQVHEEKICEERFAAKAVPHGGVRAQAILRNIALLRVRPPLGGEGVRQQEPARPHAELAERDHVSADPKEQDGGAARAAVGVGARPVRRGQAARRGVRALLPRRRGGARAPAAARRPRRHQPPALQQGHTLQAHYVLVDEVIS